MEKVIITTTNSIEGPTVEKYLDRVMYIDRINNIGEFVCKTPEGNVVGSFKDTELISAR